MKPVFPPRLPLEIRDQYPRVPTHLIPLTSLIHISLPHCASPRLFLLKDGTQLRSEYTHAPLKYHLPVCHQPSFPERCAYPLPLHSFIPRMPSPLYISSAIVLPVHVLTRLKGRHRHPVTQRHPSSRQPGLQFLLDFSFESARRV